MSLPTAQATALSYPNAPFWPEAGQEPGAEDIARRIADWIPA